MEFIPINLLHKLKNLSKKSDDCVSSGFATATNCSNVMSINVSPSISGENGIQIIPDAKLPEKERFIAAVTNKLSTVPSQGSFEYIILDAYGAVFVNQKAEIKLPRTVLLNSEQETQEFQTTLTMGKVDNTADCYLQKVAADALNQANSQIRIRLKSGYGSGDCTRNYATNLRFWNKYANNNTLIRVKQGTEKAILGVVAPPGTSQHLWGLAIDLGLLSQKQREALQQNGWFQTVENDLPHWTYVGLPEESLPQFGFQKKIIRGITYWLTPL
ncbi:MAG: peptidase M15 [Richelia sp. SM1_7_0]|nr:peptidase M15 [Richelia sp. SM1_7_0]